MDKRSKEYILQYLNNAMTATYTASGYTIVKRENVNETIWHMPEKGSELEAVMNDIHALIKRVKKIKGH